ncbi:hypothetical protein [Salinifilum ghardaiensis]
MATVSPGRFISGEHAGQVHSERTLPIEAEQTISPPHICRHDDHGSGTGRQRERSRNRQPWSRTCPRDSTPQLAEADPLFCLLGTCGWASSSGSAAGNGNTSHQRSSCP